MIKVSNEFENHTYYYVGYGNLNVHLEVDLNETFLCPYLLIGCKGQTMRFNAGSHFFKFNSTELQNIIKILTSTLYPFSDRENKNEITS